MSDLPLEQEFESYASVVRQTKQARDFLMASEFLQAVAAGRAAIDGIKLLAGYAEEVKDIQKRGEFMRIIGQLSTELAETQIKLSEYIRENHELQGEVERLLKEVDKLQNKGGVLIFRENAYYTESGEGPFCSGCYDGKQQRVHLVPPIRQMQSLFKHTCPVCNTNF